MRTGRLILKRQGLGGSASPFGLKTVKKVKNGRKILVLGRAETQKHEILGGPKLRSKIGGAAPLGHDERRFSDCLNCTGETPNFWPPELANHRQKHKNNINNNNNNNKVFF